MKLFATTCLAGFLFLAPYAQAQNTTLPDISVPPLGFENQQDKLNPESFTEYEIQNDYLGDKVKLQYQIALIKNLITWQKQVAEIQNAYQAIGVEYTDPKPARSLCKQIPANIPCYKAYPEIYPEVEQDLEIRQQQLIEENTQRLEQLKAVSNLQSVQNPDVVAGVTKTQQGEAAKQDKASTKPKKKEEKLKTDFEWVEIFCMAGECQAVLSRISNPDFRATVTMGDDLPDGEKVTKIQPGRMEISKGGRMLALKPAPVNSGARKVEEDVVPPTSIGQMMEEFSKFPGAQGGGFGGGSSNNGGERNSQSLDDVGLGEGAENNPGLSSGTGLF